MMPGYSARGLTPDTAGTLADYVLQDRMRATPRATNLSGSLWVEFEISIADIGCSNRSDLVRVQFPDGARSLLEILSWSTRNIVEALNEIGASYLNQNLAMEVDEGVRWQHSTDAGEHPRVVDIPLEFLHLHLEHDGVSGF